MAEIHRFEEFYEEPELDGMDAEQLRAYLASVRARIEQLDEEEWDAIPADSPAVTPEDRQILQTALASLADQERQVVMLHAVTGLKHREIATLLQVPLATVLSKYHRALKKLRVQLEGGTLNDR